MGIVSKSWFPKRKARNGSPQIIFSRKTTKILNTSIKLQKILLKKSMLFNNYRMLVSEQSGQSYFVRFTHPGLILLFDNHDMELLDEPT